MNTRRDIIKSSLGLAGIIAAGKAPAAIVKSLVGATGTGYTESADGWKNPYITDGLVAMWDGEWNVGGGIHDSSAKIWKDLIGTRDATLTQYGYFTSDALVGEKDTSVANNIFAATISPIGSGVSHIESVVNAYNSASEAPIVCLTGVSGIFWWGRGAAYTVYGLNGTGGNAISGVRTSVSGWNGKQVFINGINKTRTTTIYLNAGGYGFINVKRTSAELCCIRLYNRTLSADEIAANYAVDKERFNLP